MSLPEKRFPITREQYGYLSMCFSEWLRIKGQFEKRWKEMLPEHRLAALDPDFWHSALLYRMAVEGKDPLPEPPPTEHSYPVYPPN